MDLVERESVGRDFRNVMEVKVTRSDSNQKIKHKWLRAELTLRHSTYRMKAKVFCPQKLGNWVFETPEGKISCAQQKPKVISAGRGITEAARNDEMIGKLGVKG